MTAPSIAETPAADDSLYCYRHPDRETWVRCGRCERPICTQCAMQGPVGSRCKQCGTLAFDPLTSFTPRQFILGLATALVAGAIAGFIASRIGIFSVLIAWFAGGFIAEIVMRVTGYKRGPVMLGIVFGGIVVGTIAGAAGAFWVDWGSYLQALQEVAADPQAPDLGPDAFLQSFLVDAATWALLSAGAACFGAWQKLRW